jgi:hypothetical protein
MLRLWGSQVEPFSKGASLLNNSLGLADAYSVTKFIEPTATILATLCCNIQVQLRCSTNSPLMLLSLQTNHFWHYISCMVNLPFLIVNIFPGQAGEQIQDLGLFSLYLSLSISGFPIVNWLVCPLPLSLIKKEIFSTNNSCILP